MTRQEVLLAILAAAQGRSFTPAQLQKATFLVSRNLPTLIDRGHPYNFVPYDYGPFDQAVYADAEAMSGRGETEIGPSPYGRWNIYAASDMGVERGGTILEKMRPNDANYIRSAVKWVRSLGFAELVKSIYEAYPEMKVNSIFKE
jgi:hypothetical protein